MFVKESRNMHVLQFFLGLPCLSFFILITLTLSSLFYQSETIHAIFKLLREGCPLFKLDPLFLYYVYWKSETMFTLYDMKGFCN